MLRIGSLHLHSRLILAPMAGISDLPFRMLNRRFGCELAFVEMLNARSLSYKSKRTKFMLSTSRGDEPLGVQLLGCEDRYVRKGMDVLSAYRYDVLDFNAACPARKVTRRGEGAALLKDPKKLAGLLRIVVAQSKVPVTVKMRTGWDKNSINAHDAALAAEDTGIAAVFIHGRTKDQGYSGSVDYVPIRKVKKAVKIPVIASGDLFTPELVKKMFEETGCDGVTIARGALGNPWIFPRTQAYLDKGKVTEAPTEKEIVGIMTEHFRDTVAFYGEVNGVIMFRKFFAWYTKGFRHVRPLREKVSRAKGQEQMLAIFKELELE